MDDEAPNILATTFLFMIFIMGIAIGIYGIGRIGATTAAHVGALYGAREKTFSAGDTYTRAISEAMASGDLPSVGDPVWSVTGSGRIIQNGYSAHSTVHLDWLLPGVQLKIQAGSSPRVEKFFPGPPVNGFE